MTTGYTIEGWCSDYDQAERVDAIVANHRPAMPVINPLFCGDENPGDSRMICTLDAFHKGGHLNQPTLTSWPARPTVPSLRAARVDPDTIPQMQLEDASCYYCHAQAHYDVHGIPMCGTCRERYCNK